MHRLATAELCPWWSAAILVASVSQVLIPVSTDSKHTYWVSCAKAAACQGADAETENAACVCAQAGTDTIEEIPGPASDGDGQQLPATGSATCPGEPSIVQINQGALQIALSLVDVHP